MPFAAKISNVGINTPTQFTHYVLMH